MLQEQFLLLWQQDPSSTVYNFTWGARLQGHLDAHALHTAFLLLAERHLVGQHILILHWLDDKASPLHWQLIAS